MLMRLALRNLLRNVRRTVALVLTGADPDMRGGLITSIRNPDRYSAAAIERALKKRGIKLPQNVIQRHRRGDCTCPAETKPDARGSS